MTKTLLEKSKEHLWLPFTQMKDYEKDPLIIESGNGVKKQLNKIAHSTLLGMTNVPATELAEKLIEITPEQLTRVFYSDSGAEAIEIALKMAYQYWKNEGYQKKRKFISMNNGYHGDTIGAVSVRSEEHTSELQSRFDLVCSILLEINKMINSIIISDLMRK